MIRLLLVLATAPLLLKACASADDPFRSAVVRDSAGVRIAENRSEAASREWRLQLPAVLRIGRSEGEGGADGPDLFGFIAQVIRLSTGDVAAVDGLAREIRVFDEGGDHRFTVGGRGEGPGEFTTIALIGELPGDTLAAIDNLGARVSLFTSAGAFARSFTLPRLPGASAPNAVGWLDAGWLVVWTLSRSPSRDKRAQSTIFVYLVDRLGEISGTLGEFAHQRLGGNGLALAFGAGGELGVGADLWWHGHAERFDLRGHDREGSLQAIVRMDRASRPVTEEEIAEARARAEEGLRGMTGPAVERIRETEFATAHPVHGQILIEEGGGLWVERHRSDLLQESGPGEWDAFDAEGRLKGRLTAPGGFRITDVGGDFVLGIHTDSLDVETVRMYRLERGS